MYEAERTRSIRSRVVGWVCVFGLIIGGCARPAARVEARAAAGASSAIANSSARSHTGSKDPPVWLSREGARLTQEPASLAALRQRQGSTPVALELSGVTGGASVVPVGLDPDNGDLAVPPSATAVAWYEGGPAPGQSGIAVLAAHVDWHGQRGVFFNLRSVRIGAAATISLANGRTARFTIARRAQVAKTDLSRLLAGSRVGRPQLVLITCGGDFDWHTHHYADNVVLFAQPS